MANPDIPSEIVEFLNRHIGSAVQLEVLLLVHSRTGQDCSAAGIASEFRIDPAWTEQALAGLASAGVLQRAGDKYRFMPENEPLAHIVAELAKLYDQRRVTIISMIFSRPNEPIRRFTDAFRFRKDEGG